MRTGILKCTLLFLIIGTNVIAQITERSRPADWDQLVKGAAFIDRFLPMPNGTLSSDTWGADAVIPRFVDNGIEDRTWSYWGGNILKGDDGLYHLFVCGWLESSPKGHMEWSNSIVFHTVSDNTIGPFHIKDTIGKGHNPEIYRTKNGKYVLYVINGRYTSDSIDGPWEYSKFEFNPRDRRIIEGLSNLTFAQREDGSYLMVCRGGGVWISTDGLSSYNQITDKRVYPDVAGEFEDPVIWRDDIQYHLIVNDWLGRIAFYLRSKDGVNWVTDPGEAYTPGIAVHEDGRQENWFKYERLKIYQDNYGRAIQANFAVIDTLKHHDLPNDKYSSKNISIPLNPGLLLTVLNKDVITPDTKEIKVKIQAEENFNPHTDINIESLRFGASTEVNFGKGSKALRTEKSGKDLIVIFEGKGNGITKDEFAPKLIGRSTKNALLYGYAKLPYVEYIQPILSPRAPQLDRSGDGHKITIEVENFGQVGSAKCNIKLEYEKEGKLIEVASGIVPALKPYHKTIVNLGESNLLNKDHDYKFIITISSKDSTLLSRSEINSHN